MFQTVHLECYQQRSFALKMHQNRWRQPPLGGAYSAPQDSLAGLRRPTSKGGEAKGEEGMELEGRAGGEGKERDFGHSQCWREIDGHGQRTDNALTGGSCSNRNDGKYHSWPILHRF